MTISEIKEKQAREFEDWWKQWTACPRCAMDTSMRTAASNAWHIARFDIHMQNQQLRADLAVAIDGIETSLDWLNRACEMNSDNEDAYSHIRDELKSLLPKLKSNTKGEE